MAVQRAANGCGVECADFLGRSAAYGMRNNEHRHCRLLPTKQADWVYSKHAQSEAESLGPS